MPERSYPPRRRRRRRPNYTPIIFILVLVLLIVGFVAVMLHITGDKPGDETTGPMPSTEATAPSSEVTEPSTEPVIPPVTQTGSATIGATGDMLMHMPCVKPCLQSDGTYDFTPYFAHLEEYVQAVDYAVANLETTLAGLDGGYIYQGFPNFNCPDEIVSSLKEVGFDMMLTANNHTYDTQTTGFFRTQQVMQENGMDHTGTKPTAEDDDYLIKEIDGIRIGMICYTYSNLNGDKVALNGGAALPDNVAPLINTFLPSDVQGFSDDLAQDIADMRADGAEAIVLYIHWGVEYQLKQNSEQVALAQAACDLGVDVIVGGHPHVIQPMDLLTSTTDENHKTVCLYSTGNAMSNQRLGNLSNVKTAHTEDGIFFSFSFAKYSDGTVRLENVELLPLWINMYKKANGDRFYDVLPLDKNVEDWKTALDLTDTTLAKAQESYERTMDIVGEGLQEVQAYLASLPEIE